MLRISALEAGYRGSRVLTGLDLEVPEGRVTALLGRNGMGKTTLQFEGPRAPSRVSEPGNARSVGMHSRTR